MIHAHRKISRGKDPASMPQPATALSGKPAKIRVLPDGRATLEIGGEGCGIYANEAAAGEGLAAIRRMGVAR